MIVSHAGCAEIVGMLTLISVSGKNAECMVLLYDCIVGQHRRSRIFRIAVE